MNRSGNTGISPSSVNAGDGLYLRVEIEPCKFMYQKGMLSLLKAFLFDT